MPENDEPTFNEEPAKTDISNEHYMSNMEQRLHRRLDTIEEQTKPKKLGEKLKDDIRAGFIGAIIGAPIGFFTGLGLVNYCKIFSFRKCSATSVLISFRNNFSSSLSKHERA